MSKKIGVLGSGIVGITLAAGFKSLGYEVRVGNRQGAAVESWGGPVGTYKQVAANADLVVLAVKGTAAEEVIDGVKTELAQKTVIDTTNPIADQPPEDGVIQYFTSLDESLMERLQSVAPKANFVKAFNSVGNAQMVNPRFSVGKPTMFICGDSVNAKQETGEILQKFGWEVEDFGKTKSARAIEPLCMLWCIPGMLRNEWGHAFKLLKD